MTESHDEPKNTGARASRRSDIRRAAQLRESGVTPSLFRSALRSDRYRRDMYKPCDALGNADTKVKQEPIYPSSAAQPIFINSISAKKEHKHHQPTFETKSSGPSSNPDIIDLTAEDDLLSAMLESPTQTDRHRALANFEPQMWLNDINIDILLKYFASMNPTVGLLSSWDTGILRRSQSQRLPVILRNRFASLANTELWLAPVLHSGHWVLFVGRRNQSIDYFDSIVAGGYKTETTKILHEFLRCVWGDDVALPEPRTRRCPQQPNGFDCGLHVIRNADLVTQVNRPANAIPPIHSNELRRYYKAIYESLLN